MNEPTATPSNIINVSHSREALREKLLNEYSKIFLVSGKQLDQDDSAFNTYVINALSYHMADLLYNTTFLYRESTLVTAELPDTILNWATYLDYTPNKASAAKTNLLIEIDLGNQKAGTLGANTIDSSFSATIPEGHEFRSINNMVFKAKYRTDIEISGNVSGENNIRVEVTKDTGRYSVPYNINIINTKSVLSFLVEVEQYDEEISEYTIPELKPFEYFYKKIQMQNMDDSIIGIKVEMVKTQNTLNPQTGATEINEIKEEWPERNLATLEPNEIGYEAIIHKHGVELLFGNGAFGKQPSKEDRLRVTLRITKGKKGNVMAGTIINGEEMLSKFKVDYKVINPEEATDGKDFESLDDIKRNSINSLKALHRIVSHEDYVNLPDILHSDSNIVSEPILKRSDLTCNDVNLYLVTDFNKRIAKTNSIPIDIPFDHNVEFKPYTIFQYDNREWVCPFSLQVELDRKLIDFYYVISRNIFTFNRTYMMQDPNGHNVARTLLSRCYSQYMSETDTIDIFSYVVVSDIAYYSYRQTMSVISNSGITVLDPTETIHSNDNNIIVYLYTIPRKDIIHVSKIELNNYETELATSIEKLSTQYVTDENISFELKGITYSHIIGDSPANYRGLDIPVFDREYWESLSLDEKNNIQMLMINNIIQRVNDHDTRMMNVNISGKFAKTIGTTSNTQYTTEDFITLSIKNDTLNLPDPSLDESKGKFIALSDIADQNDEFYKFSGNLVFSDGIRWVPKSVGKGTYIRNKEDGFVYATDGRRWIRPNFDIPIKFKIEIYSHNISNSLVDTCKTLIVNYINSLGIERNIYLSKITELLHELSDITHIRIIKPETDIIYRNLFKNMTKEDMYLYTPEYIYTDKNNVEIIPILS